MSFVPVLNRHGTESFDDPGIGPTMVRRELKPSKREGKGMSFVDPTEIAIESHTPPIWEQEEDFGQVMNEQLKHAPWLVISVLAHAVALLLVWFALDGVREAKEEVAVMAQLPEQEPEIEDEEPIEPEPIDAEPIEDPDIVEDPVEITDDKTEPTETDSEDDTIESAFDSKHWNTSVGLGAGAAGAGGGRAGRKGKVKKRNPMTNLTIDRGLRWLADHQDEDGKWDCDEFMKHDKNGVTCDGAGNPVHDVGCTGLALLAFLGDGNTMRSGKYKKVVKKAVLWLRRQQGDDGLFGMNTSSHFIYDHAVAAYAMCEAYGLSNYRVLKKSAQMGINYLEIHRNPYGCWRYQPRDNDNDVSITGWCIMAYKSAKDFGLAVNTNALKIAANYIDEMTDTGTGRCGYDRRGGNSSRHGGDHATEFPADKGEAMTAVGLFCRFFLGQDPKEVKVMRRAAETIASRPPVWSKDGSIDHYYWYYASYALFQMGGKIWGDWSKKLDGAVVKTQRTDGNFLGSWNPEGAWGEDGGRVYSTATLVLTLAAHYRYTRLVR